MKKPVVSASWIVFENAGEWSSTQMPEMFPTPEGARGGSVLSPHVRAAVVVLLILLIGAGAWTWRAGHKGLGQIQAELDATVEQELWAVQQGKSDLATGSPHKNLQSQLKRDYAVLKDAATSAEGEIAADLEIVRLREDHAVVRVFVEIGDETYRQTRFYRSTVDGWLQIPLDSVNVGEWRLLETEYLSIGYFELDEAAVTEAASRLDALVAQMRTDFGLPWRPRNSRYVIEITPERHASEQYAITGMSVSGNIIYMASPSFLLLPASVSDGDAIVQLVGLQLIPAIVREAQDRHAASGGNARRWLPLLSALRLWEFWESDMPLAEWKDEIVEMAMGDYSHPDNVPAYEEICQAYRVWNLSPLSLSIPLTCESPQGEPLLTWDMPNTLLGLLPPGYQCCEPEGITRVGAHEVGLVTVLDYIVATYGREQLPVLVGALGEYDSLKNLIPAVFGVSVEEFEAGWQAYVAERYR